MRRLLGVQLWNIGILFLICECIQAYPYETTGYYEVETTTIGSTALDIDQQYTETSEGTIGTRTRDWSGGSGTISTHFTYGLSTWRPRRINCTAPAIERFPKPIMGPKARRYGGLAIYVMVAIFTFLGLAIVCNYFILSLDRLCEELKLSPDIAGATFMAVGSSAPELATVLMGVIFAKDDIGISTVIGSGVFNITFVISICALCTGTVCQLNWWPVVRGCFFYCLSILLMLFIIFNDVISWREAGIMLVFYAVYCVTLSFNTAFEKWAFPTKHLVTYKSLCDTSYTHGRQAVTSPSKDHQTNTQSQQQDHVYVDPNSSWDPNAACGDNSNGSNQPTVVTIGQNKWDSYNTPQTQQNAGVEDQVVTTNQQEMDTTESQVEKVPVQSKYYKSKIPKYNPLEKPVEGAILARISWAIAYPIHYMCRLTMPDCRTEKYKNWYPFTFFISMIWIAFYSYFMVWMITIIGTTLNIPDTVMGLTFVAAGVSVPNALSSIAVIKEGYGDMAVSNAIGSNVYDILVSLGLPWFIQTAIIYPGSHVNIISKGFAYTTFSLLSTVFFLLLSTHLNGWKLNKRLGIILMVWYLLFMALASLYELNFFALINPPVCPSLY